jgi:hypothetical protein
LGLSFQFGGIPTRPPKLQLNELSGVPVLRMAQA